MEDEVRSNSYNHINPHLPVVVKSPPSSLVVHAKRPRRRQAHLVPEARDHADPDARAQVRDKFAYGPLAQAEEDVGAELVAGNGGNWSVQFLFFALFLSLAAPDST